ncbi:MAG: PAAR domain-containing protein [Gemmataceae bacterium]|nr:PAAR domain-containing protein [Gemmataceae bacterium]
MVNGLVPHVGGPILPPCCETLLIGDAYAARVGDLAACTGPPDKIARVAVTYRDRFVPAHYDSDAVN